jgi:hypothetical protein
MENNNFDKEKSNLFYWGLFFFLDETFARFGVCILHSTEARN